MVRFEIVRASWSDFMVGRMCEIRVLSEVAGRKGRRLAESQACAAGSVEREGMSALGTVTVTEIPVPAKARRMAGLASKSLTRSMVVWDMRKAATVDGGGRLSATVP